MIRSLPPTPLVLALAGMVTLAPGPARAETADLTDTVAVWRMHSPTLRTGASAIYDPLRRRMIVFGGRDNLGYRDDVWALPLDGPPLWRQLEPTGPGPAARAWQAAIYDPAGDRMILYGGYFEWRPCASCQIEATTFGDVWALSLSGAPAWTRLGPA